MCAPHTRVRRCLLGSRLVPHHVGSVHDSSTEQAESFDVVVLGFDAAQEAPQAGLKRVFGIDDDAAEKVIASVPVTVQRGVNRVRAEYFRRALNRIGANVEIRTPEGDVVTEPAAAPSPIDPRAVAITERPPPGARDKPAFFTETAPTEPLPLMAASPGTPAAAAIRTQLSAADHGAAPPAEHAAPNAALRAPAHATLKEAVAAPTEAASWSANGAVEAHNAATAQTQRAPLSAFRIGDTNAPYPAPSPQMAGSAQPAAPPTAAVATPANGAPVHRTAYEGIARGAIDRGRFNASVGQPGSEPVGPAGSGVSAAAALDLDPAAARPAREAPAAWFGIAPSANGPVDLPPLPIPAATPPKAAAPAPIAATPAAKAAISARILPGEGLAAPGPETMAAAMRKQAARDAVSSLGGAREVAVKLEPRAAARPASDGAAAATPSLRAEAGAPQPPANSAGASAAPKSAPPASAAAAFTAGVATAGVSAPRGLVTDTRPFSATVSDALLFPVLGHGTAWVMTITVWGLVMGLIGVAASTVALLGKVVTLVSWSTLLALCGDYHRRCVWSVVTGERSVDRAPDLEPVRLVNEYVKNGAHLFVFAVLSQLPLLVWFLRQRIGSPEMESIDLVLSPTFWVMALGPACYWPMALTTASIHNDYAAVWYVPLGLRAIVRAPAEYAMMVFIGGAVFGGITFCFVLLGVASGLPELFINAALGLPLALSHGIMGALSGHLVRARGDAFA